MGRCEEPRVGADVPSGAEPEFAPDQLVAAQSHDDLAHPVDGEEERVY